MSTRTRERAEVAGEPVGPGADADGYAQLIEAADRFLAKQLKQGMPASVLARTIAKVAEARRPRTSTWHR